MSGISSKAAGTLENKKKYNGIEFDEDLGLNIYEAFYRHLDPQTGRWWEIDPKIDAGYESITPYNSMFNDPIRYSDFLGDEADDGGGELLKEIKSAAKETWRSLKDGVVMAKDAAVDFYQNGIYPALNFIAENLPTTSATEFVTGKSFNSGFSEVKSRVQSGGETLLSVLPMGKIEGPVIKVAVNAIEKTVAKETVSKVNQIVPHSKAIKSIINNASKPGVSLSDKKIEQLKRVVEKIGGKLRTEIGTTKALKDIKHSQVEVKGLGKGISSRHIIHTNQN